MTKLDKCKDCKKVRTVNQNQLCFSCWDFNLKHKKAKELITEWQNELYMGED